MLETLFFWALALVGAVTVVRQTVKGVRHRSNRRYHPTSLVLITQNNEKEIEGVIRWLIRKFSLTDRTTRIHVIDLSRQNETKDIVERLSSQFSNVSYEYAASDEELAIRLKTTSLDETPVSYVYDLRVKGVARHVADDVVNTFR